MLRDHTTFKASVTPSLYHTNLLLIAGAVLTSDDYCLSLAGRFLPHARPPFYPVHKRDGGFHVHRYRRHHQFAGLLDGIEYQKEGSRNVVSFKVYYAVQSPPGPLPVCLLTQESDTEGLAESPHRNMLHRPGRLGVLPPPPPSPPRTPPACLPACLPA